MAKISLGKAPKNFRQTVTVPMLDGTDGTVECVFKYRTMTEYGALSDDLAGAAGVVGDIAEISWAVLLDRKKDKNGEHLMRILEGWNLDDELSAATAQQLCDEFPGAASAIFDAYRIACLEGRLGN